MEYEWDPAKAKANLRKHRVSFADASLALEDSRALTIADPDASGEQRFVSLGSDPLGRVLVTVFTPGQPCGAAGIREPMMRKEYDFSKAKRGPAVSVPSGKTRITIRLDDDIVEWFKGQVESAGGGNYQSLINTALREHMRRADEPLEKTLRRVLREELKRAS